MNRLILGLLVGIIIGIIDIIPMLVQGLTWDANISAFSMWVVVGILISISDIKLPGPLKGILISFLVLLPSAILIGWKELFSLFPIVIMTIILGSLSGFIITKYLK